MVKKVGFYPMGRALIWTENREVQSAPCCNAPSV